VALEAQVPSEVYITRFRHKFEKNRDKIDSRLKYFEAIDKENRAKLFEELVFCLLTPQSRARTCDAAVQNLKAKNLLVNGSAKEIAQNIPGVRFQNNKSRWIIEARNKFTEYELDFQDIAKLREKLIRDYKGLGYKEASHFLRNIGFGQDIAILDRHILKNLVKVGVIDEVPSTLSSKRYLEIEDLVRTFCSKIDINLGQLDLLFWSEETGEIFK